MKDRGISTSSTATAEMVAVHWPAPERVRSFCSTRIGGISETPFDALNLSAASGDSSQHVTENIARLCHAANLPHRPIWPYQVHGIDAVDADALTHDTKADAVFTNKYERVCTVRTADCLPVLLCDRSATTVAAAHAGWRGLAAGVLEATIDAMPCRADQLLAWLGPAIGPQAYEVGPEVRAEFTRHDPQSDVAFELSRTTDSAGTNATPRWLADLYELARRRLRAYGVTDVYGGDFCTLNDSARFFSYRRDGVTGRMASGIWLAAD